ncbi:MULTISPECIES: glycosyltransferase family 4 protein [Salinibaculum]|uniref:glycosyltransferase family 4 protein n=1 Tax=Salinibaculum TaxID=2732368 RepID=UPI0030CC598A
MSVSPGNDQLRILRVSSDTYPEVTGGLGLHVHLMSKRQAERGHEVTVLTSDHGAHDLPRRERREGYRIQRHRELVNICGNSIPPGLVRMIYNASDQYDIIHAHSHLFFSTNVAAALSYVDDTPLVITNHGVRSQVAPEWIQRVYLPTVARFTLNAADRVLCYTDTDRQRIRELGVDSATAVISNGVNCSRFRPMAVNANSSQLLYVGRLTEGKGVDVLIKAFSQIASVIPEATLLLVGGGTKETELKALAAEEGVAQQVSFTGVVPNEQLPKLYNESAVFVLPSFNEGFPRTVIEAMACGTPIVVTDLEQLRSVVPDVGRTVPTDDPTTLANAVVELLSDDGLRQQLGETARDLAVSRYSWETTVEKTIEEYYDLLNCGPAEKESVVQ